MSSMISRTEFQRQCGVKHWRGRTTIYSISEVRVFSIVCAQHDDNKGDTNQDWILEMNISSGFDQALADLHILCRPGAMQETLCAHTSISPGGKGKRQATSPFNA
jgi:hypothetical protein